MVRPAKRGDAPDAHQCLRVNASTGKLLQVLGNLLLVRGGD
jgi:hypothetical protein